MKLLVIDLKTMISQLKHAKIEKFFSVVTQGIDIYTNDKAGNKLKFIYK